LVYLILSSLPGAVALLSVLAFTALAWYVADRAERGGAKDPAWIVIDEIAGFQWATLFVPPTPGNITMCFLFFRFFDIVKPPPARLVERKLAGGLGIVADDLVAALYARLTFASFVYLNGSIL